MPITFGALGDIISLCILIKDLVKCLDDCRGSSAEYQVVIRELWSLERALLEVELLSRTWEHSAELNALAAATKKCAEHCHKSVTNFKQRLETFQPLGGSSKGLIKKTASRIRWQVSEKEDLARFRAEINAHCSSINMLLITTSVWVFQASGPLPVLS